MEPRKAKYGWRRDTPDFRDHLFLGEPSILATLPTKIDLRPQCPPVYDQLTLGSCTANSIAAAVQFEREKQKLTPDFIPSRLFVYYYERLIEGTISSDAGAELRDGIKVVASYGAPPETDWPYIISKFKTKPSAKAIADGKLDLVVQYQSIAQNLNLLKGCLAAGYPFVFGISVYESFESDAVAKTGVVPMPKSSEEMLGGHAIVGVGYDDSQQRFIIRNSWGTSWGMNGYFTLPYAYVTSASLASDFWTIRLINK